MSQVVQAFRKVVSSVIRQLLSVSDEFNFINPRIQIAAVIVVVFTTIKEPKQKPLVDAYAFNDLAESKFN